MVNYKEKYLKYKLKFKKLTGGVVSQLKVDVVNFQPGRTTHPVLGNTTENDIFRNYNNGWCNDDDNSCVNVAVYSHGVSSKNIKLSIPHNITIYFYNNI